MALQRQVGNAATSMALRRQSMVQRQPSPGGAYKIPRRPKGFELAFPSLQRYGEKTLKAGTMRWSLMLTPEGQDENKDPNKPSAIMQVVFTPSKGGRSLSFLQTVATAAVGKTAKPGLDVLPDDFDPFYGADWDPKSLDWVPENARTFRNAPSQPGDPSAYLYDQPWAPPSTVKMFETVVVDMRSGGQFGALRWGVGAGRLHAADDAHCTDLATSDFGVAVDEYYATPVSGSTSSITRYEAILDEFAGSDATLSVKHRGELDRVATGSSRRGATSSSATRTSSPAKPRRRCHCCSSPGSATPWIAIRWRCPSNATAAICATCDVDGADAGRSLIRQAGGGCLGPDEARYAIVTAAADTQREADYVAARCRHRQRLRVEERRAPTRRRRPRRPHRQQDDWRHVGGAAGLGVGLADGAPPAATADLDCGDIPHRRFPVLAPGNPHGFDGNHDGVGCES